MRRSSVIFCSGVAIAIFWSQPVAAQQPDPNRPPPEALPTQTSSVQNERQQFESLVDERLSEHEASVAEQVHGLRAEILDYRADTVTWWLTGITIFLAIVTALIGAGGWFWRRKIQELEAKAVRSADRAESEAKRAEENASKSEASRHRSEMFEARAKGVTGRTRKASADVADGDLREIQELANDAREVPRIPLPERLVAGALEAQQKGQWDRAIATWRQVAELVVGFNAAWAANAWFSVGFLSEKKASGPHHAEAVTIAKDAYSKAIALDPNHDRAYRNRANLAARLERDEESLDDYRASIRIKPSIDAWFNLGNGLYKLGRFEEASDMYRSADELLDSSARERGFVLHNRGNAFVALGRVRQAEACLACAIQADPTRQDTRANLEQIRSIRATDPREKLRATVDQEDRDTIRIQVADEGSLLAEQVSFPFAGNCGNIGSAGSQEMNGGEGGPGADGFRVVLEPDLGPSTSSAASVPGDRNGGQPPETE